MSTAKKKGFKLFGFGGGDHSSSKQKSKETQETTANGTRDSIPGGGGNNRSGDKNRNSVTSRDTNKNSRKNSNGDAGGNNINDNSRNDGVTNNRPGNISQPRRSRAGSVGPAPPKSRPSVVDNASAHSRRSSGTNGTPSAASTATTTAAGKERGGGGGKTSNGGVSSSPRSRPTPRGSVEKAGVDGDQNSNNNNNNHEKPQGRGASATSRRSSNSKSNPTPQTPGLTLGDVQNDSVTRRESKDKGNKTPHSQPRERRSSSTTKPSNNATNGTVESPKNGDSKSGSATSNVANVSATVASPMSNGGGQPERRRKSGDKESNGTDGESGQGASRHGPRSRPSATDSPASPVAAASASKTRRETVPQASSRTSEKRRSDPQPERKVENPSEQQNNNSHHHHQHRPNSRNINGNSGMIAGADGSASETALIAEADGKDALLKRTRVRKSKSSSDAGSEEKRKHHHHHDDDPDHNEGRRTSETKRRSKEIDSVPNGTAGTVEGANASATKRDDANKTTDENAEKVQGENSATSRRHKRKSGRSGNDRTTNGPSSTSTTSPTATSTTKERAAAGTSVSKSEQILNAMDHSEENLFLNYSFDSDNDGSDVNVFELTPIRGQLVKAEVHPVSFTQGSDASPVRSISAAPSVESEIGGMTHDPYSTSFPNLHRGTSLIPHIGADQEESEVPDVSPAVASNDAAEETPNSTWGSFYDALVHPTYYGDEDPAESTVSKASTPLKKKELEEDDSSSTRSQSTNVSANYDALARRYVSSVAFPSMVRNMGQEMMMMSSSPKRPLPVASPFQSSADVRMGTDSGIQYSYSMLGNIPLNSSGGQGSPTDYDYTSPCRATLPPVASLEASPEPPLKKGGAGTAGEAPAPISRASPSPFASASPFQQNVLHASNGSPASPPFSPKEGVEVSVTEEDGWYGLNDTSGGMWTAFNTNEPSSLSNSDDDDEKDLVETGMKSDDVAHEEQQHHVPQQEQRRVCTAAATAIKASPPVVQSRTLPTPAAAPTPVVQSHPSPAPAPTPTVTPTLVAQSRTPSIPAPLPAPSPAAQSRTPPVPAPSPAVQSPPQPATPTPTPTPIAVIVSQTPPAPIPTPVVQSRTPPPPAPPAPTPPAPAPPVVQSRTSASTSTTASIPFDQSRTPSQHVPTEPGVARSATWAFDRSAKNDSRAEKDAAQPASATNSLPAKWEDDEVDREAAWGDARRNKKAPRRASEGPAPAFYDADNDESELSSQAGLPVMKEVTEMNSLSLRTVSPRALNTESEGFFHPNRSRSGQLDIGSGLLTLRTESMQRGSSRFTNTNTELMSCSSVRNSNSEEMETTGEINAQPVATLMTTSASSEKPGKLQSERLRMYEKQEDTDDVETDAKEKGSEGSKRWVKRKVRKSKTSVDKVLESLANASDARELETCEVKVLPNDEAYAVDPGVAALKRPPRGMEVYDDGRLVTPMRDVPSSHRKKSFDQQSEQRQAVSPATSSVAARIPMPPPVRCETGKDGSTLTPMRNRLSFGAAGGNVSDISQSFGSERSMQNFTEFKRVPTEARDTFPERGSAGNPFDWTRHVRDSGTPNAVGKRGARATPNLREEHLIPFNNSNNSLIANMSRTSSARSNGTLTLGERARGSSHTLRSPPPPPSLLTRSSDLGKLHANGSNRMDRFALEEEIIMPKDALSERVIKSFTRKNESWRAAMSAQSGHADVPTASTPNGTRHGHTHGGGSKHRLDGKHESKHESKHEPKQEGQRTRESRGASGTQQPSPNSPKATPKESDLQSGTPQAPSQSRAESQPQSQQQHQPLANPSSTSTESSYPDSDAAKQTAEGAAERRVSLHTLLPDVQVVEEVDSNDEDEDDDDSDMEVTDDCLINPESSEGGFESHDDDDQEQDDEEDEEDLDEEDEEEEDDYPVEDPNDRKLFATPVEVDLSALQPLPKPSPSIMVPHPHRHFVIPKDDILIDVTTAAEHEQNSKEYRREVSALSQYTGYEFLDLSRTLFCAVGPTLSASRVLRRLNLRGSNIRSDGLRGLLDIPTLEELNISQAGNVSTLRYLFGSPAAKKNKLRSFIAHGTPINDSGLEGIGILRKLEHLDLSMTRVTSVSCLANMQYLEELSIVSTAVDSDGVRGIQRIPTLRVLDVSVSHVSSVEHIAQSSSIEELYMMSSSLTDEGFSAIGSMPNLRILDISSTGVTTFAPLKGNRTLAVIHAQWLFLRHLGSPPGRTHNPADDTVSDQCETSWKAEREDSEGNAEGADSSRKEEAIAALGTVPTLEVVNLSHSGVSSVNCLGSCTLLRTLLLRCTCITTEGLEGVSKLQSITTVVATNKGNESQNEADSENYGMLMYIDFVRNWSDTLVKLDLSFTDAYDIRVLQEMRQLRELSLVETLVTEDGMEGVQRIPTLEFLDVSQTSVTTLGFLGTRTSNLAVLLARSSRIQQGVAVDGLEKISTLRYVDFSDTPLVNLKSLFTPNSGIEVFVWRWGERMDVTGLTPPLPCAVTSDVLRNIVKITTLQELDITGSEVRSLRFLRSAHNLRRISVGDNMCLENAGLAGLSSIKTLEYLDLSGTCITSIEPLTSSATLTTLLLTSSRIADDQTPELEKLPKLSVLGVANTDVEAAAKKSKKLSSSCTLIDLRCRRAPLSAVELASITNDGTIMANEDNAVDRYLGPGSSRVHFTGDDNASVKTRSTHSMMRMNGDNTTIGTEDASNMSFTSVRHIKGPVRSLIFTSISGPGVSACGPTVTRAVVETGGLRVPIPPGMRRRFAINRIGALERPMGSHNGVDANSSNASDTNATWLQVHQRNAGPHIDSTRMTAGLAESICYGNQSSNSARGRHGSSLVNAARANHKSVSSATTRSAATNGISSISLADIPQIPIEWKKKRIAKVTVDTTDADVDNALMQE